MDGWMKRGEEENNFITSASGGGSDDGDGCTAGEESATAPAESARSSDYDATGRLFSLSQLVLPQLLLLLMQQTQQGLDKTSLHQTPGSRRERGC